MSNDISPRFNIWAMKLVLGWQNKRFSLDGGILQINASEILTIRHFRGFLIFYKNFPANILVFCEISYV